MSAPADQLAHTRDLHRKIDKEEVRGVMMPMPEFENDKMSRSQRKAKLPPELKIPGNDRLGLGHKAGVGDVFMKPRPRVPVMIVELTATKDNLGELRKFHGLLVSPFT